VRTTLALGTVLCTLACATTKATLPSERPRTRVGVFSFVVSRASDPAEELVAVQTAALEASAYAVDSMVVGRDPSSSDTEQRVKDCGPDALCVARAVETSNLDLALITVANVSTSPALVSSRIVDAHRGAILKSVVADIGERSLADAVRATTFDLLQAAGLVVGGRVIVAAVPAQAKLILTSSAAPPSLPVDRDSFVAAPARYRVQASLDGYTPGSAEVGLHRGATEKIVIHLEPEPSLLTSPWLWTAIGAAIIGGTVAAFMLTRNREQALIFSQGPP
jgi:hypothetical protein